MAAYYSIYKGFKGFDRLRYIHLDATLFDAWSPAIYLHKHFLGHSILLCEQATHKHLDI